jgi:anti-sigma factor RsiW
MTCHDAREQFSALVDDALATEERAAVDAHLATCADCRRELQRFRDTVALMRAVAPVRAPAGFVDRVLEAARPAPWPRRLLRSLFLPWPVKLPMEAAAIVLVAVGVVLVYRGAPEIQHPVLVDSSAPAMRQGAENTAPQAPAPTPSRETDAMRAMRDARALGKAKDQAPAFARAQEAKKAPEPQVGAAPAEKTDKNVAAAPPPATPQQPEALSRDAETQTTPERRGKKDLKDLQVARKLEAPPAVDTREREMTSQYSRSESAPAPGARADAPAAPRAAPSVAGSSLASVPPDVSGRLTVSDRDAVLRGVAELVARLGAVETRRVDTPELQILELTVPREAYAEFVRELARLGRWQPSREPSALPAQVRVVLQITR